MSIDNIYGVNAITPDVAVQATDTSTLTYTSAGQERFRLDSNGNLGIGGGQLQIASNAAAHNMVFHGKNGKEVGRMEFGDGELKFEGDASEAAKVFTEWCRNQWNDLRAKDKREVLQQVMDDLMQEASGELYSEEEKVAILTCMQRVQARKKEHDAPQISEQFLRNVAKSIDATKGAVTQSVWNALAPEGKSL